MFPRTNYAKSGSSPDNKNHDSSSGSKKGKPLEANSIEYAYSEDENACDTAVGEQISNICNDEDVNQLC